MTTRAGIEGLDTRGLEQDQWSEYFDDLNRRLESGGYDVEATLELVTGEIVGPEAERLPLDSVTYERGDDEVAIGFGGRGERFPAVLWHFVERPRQIWVMERDGELAVIAIASEDGSRTLLYIHGEGARASS